MSAENPIFTMKFLKSHFIDILQIIVTVVTGVFGYVFVTSQELAIKEHDSAMQLRAENVNLREKLASAEKMEEERLVIDLNYVTSRKQVFTALLSSSPEEVENTATALGSTHFPYGIELMVLSLAQETQFHPEQVYRGLMIAANADHDGVCKEIYQVASNLSVENNRNHWAIINIAGSIGYLKCQNLRLTLEAWKSNLEVWISNASKKLHGKTANGQSCKKAECNKEDLRDDVQSALDQLNTSMPKSK